MADVKNEVPQNIRDLSNVLKKEIKHANTGAAEALPKDTYEKVLPEELAPHFDLFKKFQTFNSDLTAALALANGELGATFLKKHKDVQSVNVEMKAGKDTIGNVYSREKTVTVPGNPPQQRTTYGHSRSFYEAHAAGPNRGALKKVREYLTASAAAAAAA